MKNSVDKLIKGTRTVISGLLLASVGFLIYSPSAAAYLEGKMYWQCTDAPEHRCFLVADMVHNCPFPFFVKMDKGFWYKGHFYHYYHRYYNYENGHFHTYYYYTKEKNSYSWDVVNSFNHYRVGGTYHTFYNNPNYNCNYIY